MRILLILVALSFAAVTAIGTADAAIGPKTALRIEQPARVGMPIWLYVDIEDACLEARYPAGAPGDFGPLTDVEVRYDGVRAPFAKNWAAWVNFVQLGPMSGSACPGSKPEGPESAHRFPLHLQYAFDRPGKYAVRWTRLGGPRADSDPARGTPAPPLLQSDWLSFEVAPSTPAQREAWLQAMLAARPADPKAIAADYIPALLAAWPDPRVEHTLIDLLCSPDPDIARTAGSALRRRFDPAARDDALDRAEQGCLASILPTYQALRPTDPSLPRVRKALVEAATRHLDPADDAGTAEALRILSTLLGLPTEAKPDRALQAATDRQVMALVPALLAHQQAAAPALLAYFWRKPLSPEIHRLVWQFVEQPGTARDQGLGMLADLGDRADLPRLATILAGPSLDGDGGDLEGSVVPLREKFGADAIPLLLQVQADSPYWNMRDLATIQLAKLGDKPSMRRLIEALQSKRPAEPNFVVSDLEAFDIRWKPQAEPGAPASTYFEDRLAQAIAYFQDRLAR